MKPTTLILFDIDGTLITSGGAGENALKIGFQKEFGLAEDLSSVSIAGRTDSGIARQVLQKHGLEVSPANIERFFSCYLAELAVQLPLRPGRVLPGIFELLGVLRERAHVSLGLLTGNLERGARLKLDHYGLGGIFPFGAFADDHHDRNALGPVALARAAVFHDHPFSAAQVWIIGDTEHDIGCARAFGAKAMGVATGSFSVVCLSQYRPDALFADLGDLPSVLHALGEA
jgi:phosphoglycolate phosphatase-like HAD superfamily hydrolase